jgi:hypothetical protein
VSRTTLSTEWRYHCRVWEGRERCDWVGVG